MNHIKFSSDSLETKSEIHLLPCKIYFNGEAEVKSFFSSSITSSNTAKLVNGENVLACSLRGRPLNGILSKLSSDLIGVVCDEDKNSEKKMEIKSSFDEIYSWQLDEPELSSGTESFCKAMNWFDISNIIHSD